MLLVETDCIPLLLVEVIASIYSWMTANICKYRILPLFSQRPIYEHNVFSSSWLKSLHSSALGWSLIYINTLSNYSWLETKYSAALGWIYCIWLLLVEDKVSSCSCLNLLHSSALGWRQSIQLLLAKFMPFKWYWLKLTLLTNLDWKFICWEI